MGGMGGPPTSMGSHSMPQNSSAAGPASGKYTGFGSEDIARLGYNQENKFNAPYDPYTKGQSAPSTNTFAVANKKKSSTAGASNTEKPKKKKSKKKAQDSYDSEDDDDEEEKDSDSDDDSEDSEDRKKKAKRNKRKQRLGKAPVANRQIAGSTESA